MGLHPMSLVADYGSSEEEEEEDAAMPLATSIEQPMMMKLPDASALLSDADENDRSATATATASSDTVGTKRKADGSDAARKPPSVRGGMLLPPQVRTCRKNVVTEDTAAWTTAQAKKKADAKK